MKTAKRERAAAPGAIPKPAPSLRRLTRAQMQAAYESAKNEGKAIEPTWLRTLWEHRMEGERPAAVSQLIEILRRGLESPEMNDPKEAPRYLSRLLYLGVERFERLVAGGVVDEILPNLNALPMLYSPTAGDGASKWIWAKELFREKRVGANAKTLHGRSVGNAVRTLHWRNLAEDAVSAAVFASVGMPQFDAHRERAVAECQFDFRGVRARYGVFGRFYLLDDRSVLIWPDWVDKCRGLPTELTGNVAGFKAACLALAQEFFGDRSNQHLELFLKPLQKRARESGQSDGHARMEASKMVVAAVVRLAGKR